jgi:hypothetical protein
VNGCQGRFVRDLHCFGGGCAVQTPWKFNLVIPADRGLIHQTPIYQIPVTKSSNSRKINPQLKKISRFQKE